MRNEETQTGEYCGKRIFHRPDALKNSAEMRNTMAIIINLDVMMAKRKKGLTELAGEIGITLANLSILKNSKAKAVRLSTLNAICKALDCQPGDLLQYEPDAEQDIPPQAAPKEKGGESQAWEKS